jgi:hypothetical protein
MIGNEDVLGERVIDGAVRRLAARHS